jgi:hypothetical protein
MGLEGKPAPAPFASTKRNILYRNPSALFLQWTHHLQECNVSNLWPFETSDFFMLDAEEDTP